MIIQLIFTFLKIGMFSIGGGYAIIPLIQEQVVTQQGWIDEKVFTDIITISQMTPGPLAVNTSTFVGIQIAGIPGAIAATCSCVISGVLISILLYEFFKIYKSSQYIFRILNGLKASSLGLIMAAGLTILLLTFFGTSDYHNVNLWNVDAVAVVLFGASLFCMRKWKTGPVCTMLVCGAAGLFAYSIF